MNTRFNLGSRVIVLILSIILISQLLQFDALSESMVHIVEAAETTYGINEVYNTWIIYINFFT